MNIIIKRISLVCLIVSILSTCEMVKDNLKDDSSPLVGKVLSVEINQSDFIFVIGEDSRILTAKTSVLGTAAETVTWSSDRPKIVEVDKITGEVTAISVGVAIITATSTDDHNKLSSIKITVEDHSTPPINKVLSVEINQSDFIFVIGEDSRILTAKTTVLGTAPETVTWSSDRPKIVEVDKITGEVTAISVGVAIITATSTDDHNKLSSIKITVEDHSTPPINKVLSVDINQSDFIFVIGEDSRILTAKTSVLGTAAETVTWSSDRPKIVEVDKITGEVTAISVGVAIITATSTDDHNKLSSIEITVEAPTVYNINLSSDNLFINVLGEAVLTAEVVGIHLPELLITFSEVDSKGNDLTSGVISFEPSKDKSVKLIGEISGKAWVVASVDLDGIKRSNLVEITVNGITIELEEEKLELRIGDVHPLSIKVSKIGLPNEDVLWESTNPDIAEVVDGVVTAISEGTTTIIASSEWDPNVKDSVIVEVNPPDLKYRDIPKGVDTIIDPNLSGGSLEKYILKVLGDPIPSVELPVIDLDSGVITVTSTTAAGSYRVTAYNPAKDEYIISIFYIIEIPETILELEQFIKIGMTNLGSTADFNFIKLDKLVNITGIFSPHYVNGLEAKNAKSWVKSFNGDISLWDTSNITKMKALFFSAESFEGDLSNWNVSNVRNMNNMFAEAYKFNSNISNWKVDKVTDMHHMFSYAEVFNQDLSRWNVNKVKFMQAMFANAKEFKLNNLEDWKSKLDSLIDKGSGMFWGSGINGNNLPSWYLNNQVV